ncbi:unnamed protein product [Ilex paraguariensis]
MDAFLGYWKPNAIMLLESELWPNLIIGASRNGIELALLNARMSVKSFKHWSGPVVLPLTSLMLSKFSLIVPLSTIQAIRFQLLQAPPFIINFSGDLKYAIGEFDISKRDASMEDMQAQFAHRQVWMASSIHKGEEEVILGVHKVLKQMHPDVVTIIVPRHPQLGQDIAMQLQQEGVNVALRSHQDKLMPGTSIYVVDTLGLSLTVVAPFYISVYSVNLDYFLMSVKITWKLDCLQFQDFVHGGVKCSTCFVGELRQFYRLTPIAVIGGSFLPGLAGHNISEAAAAGCAVLTGNYVGHFSHMAMEMQRLNPLSVLQISDERELAKVLSELFSDVKLLEARRVAAKQAFHVLSNGIIENIWNLLNFHIFRRAMAEI